MWSRIASFIVWALAAAAAVYWGLRVFVQAPAAPAAAVVAAARPPADADWTRLFGADVAPAPVAVAEVPADARFQLVGLVAPRGSGSVGVALIGVDGKPARAYRPGASIDGGLVVQSIQAREVTLGPAGGPARVRLQMAPLPPAATGALPPVAAAAMPGAAPTVPAAPAGGLFAGRAVPRPGGTVVNPFGAALVQSGNAPPGMAPAPGLAPAAPPVAGRPPPPFQTPVQESNTDAAQPDPVPQPVPASGAHRRRLTTM